VFVIRELLKIIGQGIFIHLPVKAESYKAVVFFDESVAVCGHKNFLLS